jgi:hypothetical protein
LRAIITAAAPMAISIRPAQKSLLFKIDEFIARPDSEQ